jgi:hypothetical protein
MAQSFKFGWELRSDIWFVLRPKYLRKFGEHGFLRLWGQLVRARSEYPGLLSCVVDRYLFLDFLRSEPHRILGPRGHLTGSLTYRF